ncbi:aldo/keto reductase [Histomonas meleagridis]|uniref:aldo/keto reductase n=1 Tax=Histomonas meleagridis TaxID=135588 RepID=UPI00355AA7C4|nr:aldo/keto reductase [Histomonas meleagridis]KAH0799008.1 aldo/keto reductase [Histomonas meleagridis]
MEIKQEVTLPTRMLRDLKVSAIGYGSMGLSHGYGDPTPHDQAIHLIHEAYRQGCTFFDTAEVYAMGENEKIVGEALEPIRDKVVLSSKFMFFGPIEEPGREGVLKEITKHLDASLKRLRTTWLDLYYWHRPTHASVEDVAWAMGEIIKTGKVRCWGMSQVDADQIRRAHAITPLTAIQCEFSIMERMYEKEVIPTCKELRIGFVPFSPLASGFLSGKYTAETKYTGDDVRRVITRFSQENIQKNQELLNYIKEVAASKHVTPAQISLAWIMCKGDFVVSIPGMRTDERIKENFGASFVTLTKEEYESIEERLKTIPISGNRTDADIAKLADVKLGDANRE